MMENRLTASEKNEYFVYTSQNDRIYIKSPEDDKTGLTIFEAIYYLQWLNINRLTPIAKFTLVGSSDISIKDLFYIPDGSSVPQNLWEVLKATLSDDNVKHTHYKILNKVTKKYLNYTGKASDVTESTALTLWELLPLITVNPEFEIDNMLINDYSGNYTTFKDWLTRLLDRAERQRYAVSEILGGIKHDKI